MSISIKLLAFTTVLSVDSNRKPILILSNDEYLDDETKVRRIKRLYRGKLVDFQGGGYKKIKEYRLNKSGVDGVNDMDLGTSTRRRAKKFANIIQKHKQTFVEKVKETGLGDCSDMLQKVGK